MDTLHTNEERLYKIRCLFDRVENIYVGGDVSGTVESLLIDIDTARECLDGIEKFINARNALDAI